MWRDVFVATYRVIDKLSWYQHAIYMSAPAAAPDISMECLNSKRIIKITKIAERATASINKTNEL